MCTGHFIHFMVKIMWKKKNLLLIFEAAHYAGYYLLIIMSASGNILIFKMHAALVSLLNGSWITYCLIALEFVSKW